MLFLFLVINFADKAVLGLAGSSIISELRLSHAQFGQLGSVFFLLFSWHAAFGALGALGLAWVLIWTIVGREGPASPYGETEIARENRHISYFQLMTCRTIVGAIVLGFSAYWLLSLAVVWLPNYLSNGAGYSPSAVGWIVAVPAVCQILAVPALSAYSERLKRRGISSRASRGMISAGSVLLAGTLTFALPWVRGSILPILFTAVAFGIGPAVFALGPVMAAEVSPAGQRGAILGFNTAMSTLAGIFAPAVTGFVVDLGVNPAEGFRMAFMFAGAMVVAGSIIGWLLIDPEADILRFGRLEVANATRSA
jgi:ACS family D-galactonate transporter-like MFS transporter